MLRVGRLSKATKRDLVDSSTFSLHLNIHIAGLHCIVHRFIRMILPSLNVSGSNYLLRTDITILLQPSIFSHFIYPILSYIMVCTISHVGIAIFNPPGFPTQWVLALCNNELFQGRVLCSTVGINVNGWYEFWVECDWSPVSFNRAAMFVGVVHIAVLNVPMETIHAEFLSRGTLSVSNDNPAYTDRYVLRALRRIGERRFGPASLLTKEQELGKAVRAKIADLVKHQCPPASHSYPVASLSLGEVREGKVRWF